MDQYSVNYSAIQTELEPGESVLWTGRPDPRRSMLPAFGCWLFAVPWTAFAVFWMWGAAGFGQHPIDFSSGQSLFPLFGLPFVLIGLGMLSAPYWALQGAKRTVYAVTNRRLMIILEGRFRKVKSFYDEDIGRLERRERPDGSGDLVFARHTYRDSDGDTRTQETAFTDISDVRTVERLIADNFKLANRTLPGGGN